MILEVVKGYDGVLVQSVETTLGECSDLVDAMGFWVGEKLHDTRRRDEDSLTEQLEGKMETCDAIFEIVDSFRTASEDLLRPAYGTIGVSFSEGFFVRLLLSHVSKKIGDVLYIASRDGDSPNFHDACDGKGPTIVIVQTTTGNIFGGYAGTDWTGNSWISSSTAFLFSVRPTLEKYPIIDGKLNSAMYSGSGYQSPVFGEGHDIKIDDHPLTSDSYTNAGHTYEVPSSYHLTGGERYFLVRDYVVLQAIAL